MQAIILAGGAGTRLRARVSDVPKPMAPVAGRPFLEYLIARLLLAGCRRIVLSVGYLHEKVSDHFGARAGAADIAYAVEDRPLGTGGAIALALRSCDPAEPVLVMNGDSFLDVDLAAFADWYRRSDGEFGMVLRKVDDVSRFGEVRFSGERVTEFIEKGGEARAGWINAGIYALRAGLFERFQLPDAFSLERDVLGAQLSALDVRAFPVDGYFIDIGIPEEFDRAQRELPQYCTALRDLPGSANG